MTGLEVQDIETLLAGSASSGEFKTAVRAMQSGGKAFPPIKASSSLPAVKVMRAISKLLEAEPALEIRDVVVEGHSGCSDFRGSIDVNGGEARFDYLWDCRWRAEQEGLKDWFGNPDQAAAARQFGYQCFVRFERIK